MKKNVFMFFHILLLTLFICGCSFCCTADGEVQKNIQKPAENISADKKTPPEVQVVQVQATAEEKKTVTENSVSTPPAAPAVEVKKEVAAEKKEIKVIPPAPQPPPPPIRTRSHENYRRGPGMWRAFNRLSPEVQKELLQLQRTDPEKYRKILHEKADELYEAEKIRRQELDDLTAEIKKTEDAAEKERLKEKLRSKLKEDFQQRLQDTRHDIEIYKRRTARLESELQKREKNCDAIINAILNNRLSDNPQPPRAEAEKSKP